MRYDQGLSQAEIAQELAVSEATVSRAIKDAFEDGILEVRVSPEGWRDRSREQSLVARFGLSAAIVVQPRAGGNSAKADLARAAALFLQGQMREQCVVGVSDGESASVVAAATQRVRLSGIEVVSMIGGLGAAQLATHSAEIARTLAANIGGVAWQLPAPALVDSPEVAELLLGSAALRPVQERMAKALIALVGIGAMSLSASIVRHGAVPETALPELAALGAIGSVCGRFFDENGLPVSSGIDRRTLAISLEALRRIPVRLGVATGAEKVPAIVGALRGGLASVLATDAETADALCEAVG